MSTDIQQVYKQNGMPKTHGLCRHPLYLVYKAMISRCYDENNKQYHRYGGIGITVCDEWKKDFVAFYNWCIENGWEKGLFVDKDIKPFKRGEPPTSYSPNNCSLVTHKENSRTKCDTIYVEYNGEKIAVSTLLDKICRSEDYWMIKSRLDYGWPLDIALSKPKGYIWRNKRATGINSPRGKFTDKEIREIFFSKDSNRQLGKRFNINHKAIFNIKHAVTYPEITKSLKNG